MYLRSPHCHSPHIAMSEALYFQTQLKKYCGVTDERKNLKKTYGRPKLETVRMVKTLQGKPCLYQFVWQQLRQKGIGFIKVTRVQLLAAALFFRVQSYFARMKSSSNCVSKTKLIMQKKLNDTLCLCFVGNFKGGTKLI